MRKIAAMTRIEVLLTLRRGESLLVAIAIPVGILVFFSVVDILPHSGERAVDFLVPGVLALSVVSSAMTSSSIATGFERQTGVLRRLGTTPLGRSGLLTAKVASLVVIVALQVAAIVIAGLALGWTPTGRPVDAVLPLVLGVVAFAALGFWLAGHLRAETNLAVANGLFLVFLLLGGIVVSIDALPETMAAIAQLLPAEPLATALRSALDGTPSDLRPIATLAGWAAGGTLLAARGFRWG